MGLLSGLYDILSCLFVIYRGGASPGLGEELISPRVDELRAGTSWRNPEPHIAQ